MDHQSYYEPDLNLLNRKARLLNANGRTRTSASNLQRNQQLAAVISAIRQDIDWEECLSKASYVVFDTETTGLEPFNGDEITSLGAVVLENGRILDEPLFYQLVNPKRPVSEASQSITGITNEMLYDKPDIIQVLVDFLKFAGPRILIAHNALFDLAFINKNIGSATGGRIENPVIDTVLLTSALYYAYGDYSLENLATRFNLNLEGRHNALSDARIAASLFLKLLPELKRKGIDSLPQLENLFKNANPARGYPLIY